MSDTSAPAVDLTGLRRLLGESERDVAALSREEADRIIAIHDHDRRLRAYLRLRELWAYAGDRMAPEDEARIQASFSGEGTARDIEPPPAAPEIYQPLTPVSLLRWADAWRSALVASALKRSSDGANPGDMLELSAAVGGGQAGSEFYVPEIGIIGQLDTLIGELRDGLDARQLLPGEALQGQIGNLSGLVKVVAAARARRDMVVPPVPAMPASRCRVDEILDWLEALMLFEEAIGARALIQAGRVPEPGEARRQFLASARGGISDIGGHAAAQLASWRRAESVHRAVSGAVRAGWLTRDRVIVLPSFDVTELEAFFGVFGGGLPALPAAPKAAGPAEAAGWWQQRRRVLVRSIALDLLADGTLRGIEDLDRRAEEMTIRGLVRILPEVGGLAEVDAVLAACSSAAARSGDAGTVPDAGEAAAVLSKWDRKAASGAFRPPAAPVPTPTKAEDAVVSPAPVRVVPDVEEVRTAVPPSQKMVTESRSSREPRRWREAIGRAISRAWFPLGAVVSVVIYQSVVLGFILIAWGGRRLPCRSRIAAGACR